ncbi:MAG: hypothetical protein ACXVBY_17555, partial [Isosphaeraceae bacterium]
MLHRMVNQLRRYAFKQVVGIMLVGMLVTACSGSTPRAPAPYKCGGVGTMTGRHCYAKATIGDHITGFSSDIWIAERMQPENGFITNEFWLNGFTGVSSWIEIGYIQNSVEQLHYFWAENDENGIFHKETIANVPTTEVGTSVRFAIIQVATDTFRLEVKAGTTHFSREIHLHLWDDWQGGYIEAGQELAGTDMAGTGGAEASLAQFTDMLTFTRFSKARVDKAAFDVDGPPYAGWLVMPPAPEPGPAFATWCCHKERN